MRWFEHVWVVVVAAGVVGGCEPKLGDFDGGEGPGTTTGDDVGEDDGSTGAPDPIPQPGECEDCPAHCAQIATFDDCNQELVTPDGGAAGWCRWVMYASVEYDAATDQCAYGKEMGTCMHEALPVGACDNLASCNEDAEDVFYDPAGLGVAGSFCTAPDPLKDMQRCTGGPGDPGVCRCACASRWWGC